MARYNLPTTNCTSGAAKFFPNVKEIFDKPLKVKKRRYRYDIYKGIDANYYDYMDDEDSILKKFECPREEEMHVIV
jgi:pre-mRNA-splicing factor ISY1